MSRYLANNGERYSEHMSDIQWGNESIRLYIAGGAFNIEGLASSQAEVIRERFADALTELPVAGDLINIRVLRVASAMLKEYIPDFPTAVLKTTPKEDAIRVDGHHFTAVLHWSPTLTGCIQTSESHGLAFRLAFENYFRLVVAYHLLREGSLLTHAGAVVDDGVADIFIGCSGYGKSTISRLRKTEGATVLSDDMVAISIHNDGLYVQALPFTGDLPHYPQLGEIFPVRAILHLKKGERHCLSSALSCGRAMSALMVCAPYINIDPYRSEQLMNNTMRFANASSSHTLTFAVKEGIGHFLDRQLSR